eukprot:UN17920
MKQKRRKKLFFHLSHDNFCIKVENIDKKSQSFFFPSFLSSYL